MNTTPAVRPGRLTISVITSVYKNAAEIRGAIESVLAQRDVAIEFIVVDGGSKDGTLEILQSFGNSITTLVSGPDRGIYDGLNRGVHLATGDYIGFLHSDDLFADDQALRRLFAQVPDPGGRLPAAVYGDLVYVEKDNPAKIVRYWKSSDFSLRRLKNGWMPPHPSLYVRRDVFLEAGLFDIDFRIAADYKFILKLFSRPLEFRYVPGVVVHMRTGGASNRSLKAIVRKTREDFHALKTVRFWPARALIFKNLSKISQFFRRGA